MVIKKMSEMIDGESSKTVITSSSTLKSTEETDSLAVDNNNVQEINKHTFTHHESNMEVRLSRVFYLNNEGCTTNERVSFKAFNVLSRRDDPYSKDQLSCFVCWVDIDYWSS